MSAYDLKSYALAIQLRSRKTVLVEGPTDKRVVARMLMERELAQGVPQQCLVDDASLLSREATFAGLGNKERVERIAVQLAAYSQKMNWLVDREWEGIDLTSLSDPVPDLLPTAWGHRTKGHSIENYWLHADALTNYLKMTHGADLPAEYFLTIPQRFAAMLRIATAFSLAARRLRVITCCMQLVRASHVEWSGTEYVPTPALGQAAAQRGVAVDLTAETLSELQRADVKALTVGALRWLCHGHLGEEMLRACAASLAIENGMGVVVSDRIERGFHTVKLAHDADWLTRIDAEQIEPLDQLIQWAV